MISAAKNLKIRRLKLSNITHLKFWKMYRKRIVCITILMYNKNINIDFHFQGFIGCNCAYILKSECVWIKVLADYLNWKYRRLRDWHVERVKNLHMYSYEAEIIYAMKTKYFRCVHSELEAFCQLFVEISSCGGRI